MSTKWLLMSLGSFFGIVLAVVVGIQISGKIDRQREAAHAALIAEQLQQQLEEQRAQERLAQQAEETARQQRLKQDEVDMQWIEDNRTRIVTAYGNAYVDLQNLVTSSSITQEDSRAIATHLEKLKNVTDACNIANESEAIHEYRESLEELDKLTADAKRQWSLE